MRPQHLTVRFHHPREEVFDFLVDPRNRPTWQSSLTSVRLPDDEGPRLGQRWVDRTSVGLEPDMETTVFERPHLWAEEGRWRGVLARLSMRFEPVGDAETDAFVEIELSGSGRLAGLGLAVVRLVTPFAVASDLKRADRHLRRPG